MDMVQKGVLKLQYVSIDEQVVDVLTKTLSWVKFEYLCDNLGVVRKDFPGKEEQWWLCYRIPSQGGIIMICNLLKNEEVGDDMDPPQNGGEGW